MLEHQKQKKKKIISFPSSLLSLSSPLPSRVFCPLSNTLALRPKPIIIEPVITFLPSFLASLFFLISYLLWYWGDCKSFERFPSSLAGCSRETLQKGHYIL